MKSVCGCGIGKVECNRCGVEVELIGTERRALDLKRSLPKFLLKYESKIVRTVSKHVLKGNWELSATFYKLQSGRTLSVDWDLADQYRQIAKSIRTQFLCDDDFNVTAMLRSPDLLQVKVEIDDELVHDTFFEALDIALQELDKNRLAEGELLQLELIKLVDDFCVQVELCADRLNAIQNASKESTVAPVFRSTASVGLDISEVFRCLTNVVAHTANFKQSLHDINPVGRKLLYIYKEIYKEIDNIGRTTRDLDLTNRLIDCKLMLEKIEEKMSNVE